ncbi:uncharacterized protein [Palaemon carinicauda]|uniref:uncharacterized protein n=1 Tax=Palaemon carinicauda TaxID=392227 RepID=UPI0035B62C86
MSMRSDQLRNSSAQPNTTSIISSPKHNCIYRPTDTFVRKASHSQTPLNPPLLVVSPTSPVAAPSRLPVVVPRRSSKQVAPVIHCTSWLHSEEEKRASVVQHASHAYPSLSSKEEEDLQLLPSSQKLGFRGSKIPVRSAKGISNHSLVVYPTPRASRSKSLTSLLIDDFPSTSSDFRHQQSDTASKKSIQGRCPTPSPGGLNYQSQVTKSKPLPTSPYHPHLRQLSTSSSNLSLSSLQSPSSLSSVYPFSPRVSRRSCEEPPKAFHEPYETSQYFTFHLTLRNPAKSPSRKTRPVSRSGNNNSQGSVNTEASQAATRCVEDMILQTCAVPSPEMLQSVRLPHSIHMPQVPQRESSIESDSDYKGDNDVESENIVASHNQKNEEEAQLDQRCLLNEDSNNMNDQKDASANGDKSLSSPATAASSPFELGSIEDIHCLSFGIVDYLNAVMKFQDSEREETESICSDCGSGLTITPPTRLSDTDSVIEAIPVSSDAHLKGSQCSRNSAPSKNKPDIQNVKWRSSQELLTRPGKRRLFQRQLSDIALRSRLQERNLHGTSVQVYDGNLGVSVVKLPRNNRSSAPSRKQNRRCLSAKDERFTNNYPSRHFSESPRMDRHLVHEESGESIMDGYHDSLIAEPSDTEYGENMEIDQSTFLSTGSSSAKSESLESLTKESATQNEKNNSSGFKLHKHTEQNFYTNNKSSGANKSVKGEEGLSSCKLDHLPEPEIDRVLGILEDDGMGPGLSEDEMNATESPPANCVHPSPRGVGMISPHKILWYLQESKRRSNESGVRRFQPHQTHYGTASASKCHRIEPSSRDGSLRNFSISDTSQPASAIRKQVRQYSESSQYDSSADESDTGAELSELERCVLSLNHRRSQLRKQDTNAYLIAPPEYKIGEDISAVLEDS